MTHVQIKLESAGHGSLLVDGVDIARAVKAGSLVIDTSKQNYKVNGAPVGPVEIQIILMADRLDVELPDAVVIASEGEEQ